MKWLVMILTAIFQAILPSVSKAAKGTAEDSRRQPQLRNRLRDKAKAKPQAWNRLLALEIDVVLRKANEKPELSARVYMLTVNDIP